MLRLLPLLAFVVFTVGCSSLPPKTEAIHNALVTDTALRYSAQACARLGPEERQLATREHSAWWQRNNRLVLGADYGLLDLNWQELPKGAETQRAVLAMQVLELVQEDAESLSASWFGDRQESEDCEKIFKQVNKGKLDLSKPKKQAEVLQTFYDARVSLDDKTDAARSINSRYRKYGRSLFVVEKELKEAGCSAPNISMLRNSWPIEVYDAACSANEYLIVKCEWGQCDVKR
jgi:hypothetical protein